MFISFEGIEGSGKSTAQRLLAEHLQGLGYDPLLTREPGGCALGRSLRPILLDARTRGLSSRAELYLFLADRAQHVAEVIRPALEAGQTVLWLTRAMAAAWTRNICAASTTWRPAASCRT